MISLLTVALGGVLRPGCLVPASRSLYWVNRGLRGRTVIAAAGMDGSNRQELTVVSMEEPIGLSLDHVAGRLYWISEYKEVGTGGSSTQTHQDAVAKAHCSGALGCHMVTMLLDLSSSPLRRCG